MFCSKCGRETVEGALFCAKCGASLAGGLTSSKKTWRSTTAGVLGIIDASLKAVFVSLSAVGVAVWLSEGEHSGDIPGAVGFDIVVAISGMVAMIGGICAIRRKGWGWALAGAIAAILPFFPLGIASTVLIVMSRDEFEQRQPGMPQQQRTGLI